MKEVVDYLDININYLKSRVKKGSKGHKSDKITTPKTNSIIRIIPIPNILLNDLKMLLERDKRFYEFNYKWFVFGRDIPITNYKVRYRKNMLCKMAGLKQIRIHNFRHSCASLLINNGANITIVAKYLGHIKIDKTLNTYSHMFKNKLNNIVSTINKLT